MAESSYMDPPMPPRLRGVVSSIRIPTALVPHCPLVPNSPLYAEPWSTWRHGLRRALASSKSYSLFTGLESIASLLSPDGRGHTGSDELWHHSGVPNYPVIPNPPFSVQPCSTRSHGL
uniref:Uncharacterized protein n=1 Tax=Romanomermis culicivorax TaxID=13658 RepID=A0A915JZC3_ROMCU